jgi:hypothetical protein
VRVVIGGEPVAAPLVNVLAHFVKSEGVGWRLADGFGSGEPSFGVVRARLRWFVAPGIESVLFPGASGALPFGFGGKSEVLIR